MNFYKCKYQYNEYAGFVEVDLEKEKLFETDEIEDIVAAINNLPKVNKEKGIGVRFCFEKIYCHTSTEEGGIFEHIGYTATILNQSEINEKFQKALKVICEEEKLNRDELSDDARALLSRYRDELKLYVQVPSGRPVTWTDVQKLCLWYDVSKCKKYKSKTLTSMSAIFRYLANQELWKDLKINKKGLCLAYDRHVKTAVWFDYLEKKGLKEFESRYPNLVDQRKKADVVKRSREINKIWPGF